MSKLYKKYKELKEGDSSKYYLFESGIFYLFLDNDAIEISKIFNLKLTHLNDEIYKCGFPKNSINKYLEFFNQYNLDICIVDNKIKSYSMDFCLEIINHIKSIDINKITPLEALNIISNLKEKL